MSGAADPTQGRTPASRRAEASQLAEELLGDIELSRITGTQMVRKASRLARLLDDEAGMSWLGFEVSGYPTSELPPEPWAAANRSGRVSLKDGKTPVADTRHVGQIEAAIEGARAIFQTPDPSVSVSSANPSQYVVKPSNAALRWEAIRSIARDSERLNRVIGPVHQYVSERYGELRFGAAVESAFEVMREAVDRAIVTLVPDAAQKLAAAFENASSDNPEHWAAAAATCRRLLKAAADALRPPSDPVGGHEMTDAHYINRLVSWIRSHSESATRTEMVVAELEDLGRRLDAVQGAGSQGAHAEVDRFDASRYISGTYLLLGDILRLAPTALPSEPATGLPIDEESQTIAMAPEEEPTQK